MVHINVWEYIINVFPSIIVFLYRYLRSDDNQIAGKRSRVTVECLFVSVKHGG